ncbi:MAG: Holliday junction branch migration protein RuvA [Chloroflexota bacterium]|nr:Holliday junction branch migration protein RuvA [Chloroflexia bacterium]MDQ3226344.1 Holliday junction branch migration protein RuvA [Chloroflexota bacterium]
MIAALKGRIERKQEDAALVDVGGVVYRVNTSLVTLEDIGDVGENVRLFTHLYVREDQLTLYGFASTDELRLFETLIGVSGVGPRLALAILSRVRPDALELAIDGENAELLATVPGVGRKTAARLILELRGKLVPASGSSLGAPSRVDADVVEALRSLGYTTAEAHGALVRIPRDPELTIEDRVLAALRELSEA